ncbi:MAG: VacB/RNase II family 3'-5' exoribonuclease [Acidobacteriia bacterium]|nr:VacB/RNase II family 3'-5' exoribonuclease [Terriglobia bacterium]
MREFPSPQAILKLFERNPEKTYRLRELVVELQLRSSEARELKRALKELARARRIVYLKKNHYALVHKDHHPISVTRPSIHAEAAPTAARGPNVVSGRLIGHRDGFGFVVPDQPLAGTDLDIYIGAEAMGSALHGDRVEVQVLRSAGPAHGGRLEGRILRVTERAQKTVVGQFHSGPRFNYVLPFDHRIPFEIVIPHGQEWPSGEELAGRNRQFGGESEVKGAAPRTTGRRSAKDLDGMIVDVELTTYPRPAALPRGRVIEILGRREEFGVDVEIVIRKYHLPHRFPAEVLAEAAAVPQYLTERDRAGRRDFRGLPIVTIDGETAKDFDDAVLVERQPWGNYLLHVHIADVAHYVRPGSPLDREARLRGTSVYFPDRAVPMLPLDLSNGICSLNPHVDRLVMSCLMEIDPQGRIVEYELSPGIIRSAERMTYTAVRDILAGEPAACQHNASLLGNFRLMEELARILNRRRDERGSIDFDLPEPLIEFDEYGRMVGITRSERNIAHRIIEEFMLAANETVAGFLEGRNLPSLYRIHEKPDPKKVLEFEEIAATFGYSLGVELPAAERVRVRLRDERERYPRFLERADAADLKITPRHYQRLTKRLEGKPEERILSYLMLRSLKQARYSEENVGHFALAATTYTHFTSPIRRYPDLIVHRILKAALGREGGSVRVQGVASDAAHAKPDKKGAGRLSHARTLREAAATPAAVAGGAFVPPQELQALAAATSEAERRAADAERELIEWKKVSFMAQHVGDEFDALIISLIKHGFFVELLDLFVEGFVSLASLGDDYYVYRERQRAIIGQHTHRAFHLGEAVRVRLDRIDREGNKLEFSVVD